MPARKPVLAPMKKNPARQRRPHGLVRLKPAQQDQARRNKNTAHARKPDQNTHQQAYSAQHY